MKEFIDNNPVLFIALKVVGVLFLTFLLTWVVRLILNKVEKKAGIKRIRGVSQISQKLLKNIVVGILYVIGIFTAINQIPSLSSALSTVLAGSGILAVIVGFAAQESFGNLVSGIFLTLFKPFDVGNRVRLVSQDINGYIEDITLRHTVIRTVTDTRLLVPNSVMGSAIVENTNYVDGNPTKNFIDVDVAYDTDLEKAMAIMSEVIVSHPKYVGVKPLTIYVRNFAASGISLRGTMTTRTLDDNYIASSEARIALKKAFDAAGIVIPYQTVTISNNAPGEGIRLVSDKSND